MIVTVLMTTFKKAKPKGIIYRSYKYFDKNKFRDDLRRILRTSAYNYSNFETDFLEVLNVHAPF